MNLTTAFDEFQTEVNADPDQLKEARRRRDLFRTAFGSEDDVTATVPTGSLARGTMLEPIHDVDLVIVYDGAAHPDWGEPGPSAEDALVHVASRVKALLGHNEGTVERAVRLARPRNHCVQCFLDHPEEDQPFTVDVTPALRQADGTLLIPEKRSEKWILADPEDLIERIAERHRCWNRFVPMVRVLKHWNRDVAVAGMKSLVVEVLAYECIPDEHQTDQPEARPDALARFLASAVVRIEQPVEDPAGLCGVIQPDLDVATVQKKLQDASDGAFRALAAEQQGDVDAAVCAWRTVLGDDFPEPPGGCGGSTRRAAAATTFAAPRLVRDTPQGVK